MTVGNQIRKIRLEKGLTQREVSERCGIAEPTIRKYESGKLNPKRETLQRIARALEVPWISLTGDQSLDYVVGKKQANEVRKETDLINAILTILNYLYGGVEDKEISGRYGSTFCYFVGKKPNRFALYEDNVDALKKLVLSTVSIMTEQIKDSRPEQKIVDEMIAELNSDSTRLELLNAVKNRLKEQPEDTLGFSEVLSYLDPPSNLGSKDSDTVDCSENVRHPDTSTDSPDVSQPAPIDTSVEDEKPGQE